MKQLLNWRWPPHFNNKTKAKTRIDERHQIEPAPSNLVTLKLGVVLKMWSSQYTRCQNAKEQKLKTLAKNCFKLRTGAF